MTNSADRNANILRIFLATDLHLGHLENDPIRGDDSFIAFEEILQSAKDHKVDMIILGGDLFHINKPSRRTIWKTMKLFRKYCVGSGDVKFKIVSDQALNFPNNFGGKVNYEDPNMNISIPVFSIHGNHDDPAGGGGLCALEILSMANLVNYFGKSETVDEVDIYPILFEKGATRFALYGLGYIRDERLHATFQERKVKFFRPQEKKEDWFSMFVLHQNRVSHDKKSYVDESMLENFLDFIFWGHEHECLIKPQPSGVGDFHICQPGSPIATSLCEGEAKQKFVGILEVFQNKFRLKEIPLKAVRPFVMDSLEMSSTAGPYDPDSVDQVSAFLIEKIEELITRATALPYGKEMLPLIRLRVEHNGGISFPNPHRLSAMFVGRIANPNEVLLVKRKRVAQTSNRGRSREKEEDDDVDMVSTSSAPEPKIGDVIGTFIKKELVRDMIVHDEKELNYALSEFVDKLDPHSFDKCVRKNVTEASHFVEKSDEFNPKEKTSVGDILIFQRKGKEEEGEGGAQKTNKAQNVGDETPHHVSTPLSPQIFEVPEEGEDEEEEKRAHPKHNLFHTPHEKKVSSSSSSSRSSSSRSSITHSSSYRPRQERGDDRHEESSENSSPEVVRKHSRVKKKGVTSQSTTSKEKQFSSKFTGNSTTISPTSSSSSSKKKLPSSLMADDDTPTTTTTPTPTSGRKRKLPALISGDGGGSSTSSSSVLETQQPSSSSSSSSSISPRSKKEELTTPPPTKKPKVKPDSLFGLLSGGVGQKKTSPTTSKTTSSSLATKFSPSLEKKDSPSIPTTPSSSSRNSKDPLSLGQKSIPTPPPSKIKPVVENPLFALMKQTSSSQQQGSSGGGRTQHSTADDESQPIQNSQVQRSQQWGRRRKK